MMTMPLRSHWEVLEVHEDEVTLEVLAEDAKTAALEFEEESTDVGSGLSDAESTCSSVAMSLGGGRKPKLGQVLSTTPTCGAPVTGQGVGGRRRRPVPRSLCLGAGGHFSGTPLEPIPGTPEPLSPQKRKAKAAAARRSCNLDCEVEAMMPGFRPPPGLPPPDVFDGRPLTPAVFAYEPSQSQRAMVGKQPRASMGSSRSLPVLAYGSGTGGVPTVSPKRYARDRMLVKARQDAVPLKVALPELALPRDTRMLDPTLPVKKKSAFADSLGECAATNLDNLEPSMPAKKRVSTFLLMEPPQVLPTQVQPR